MQARVFKHVLQVIVCPNVYYCSALQNPIMTDSLDQENAIYKPVRASKMPQHAQTSSCEHYLFLLESPSNPMKLYAVKLSLEADL